MILNMNTATEFPSLILEEGSQTKHVYGREDVSGS